MADKTHIEWTDATWNPVTGCSVVSPGCTNCYAMRLAGTRLQHHYSRAGLTTASKAGPVWNGQVRFNTGWLDHPLRWKSPRRIFVCAHGDLFHENVPAEWIDQVFAVMALCPRHTFQVLTKRASRMRGYLSDAGLIGRICDSADALGADLPKGLRQQVRLGDIVECDAWALRRNAEEGYLPWPLPNVWAGVSVEDQPRADERITELLETPAAVRWISAEPLLGPLHFTAESPKRRTDWLTGEIGRMFPYGPDFDQGPKIDWVVVGGESGPGARPMHPDWARSIRDDCAAAGVPFLFKQWGEFVPCQTEDDGERLVTTPHAAISARFDDPRPAPVVTQHGQEFWQIGKRAAGRTLDGVLHDAYPEARA